MSRYSKSRKFCLRTVIATVALLLAACLAVGAAQAAPQPTVPSDTTVYVVGGTDDPNADDMLVRVQQWWPGVATHTVATPETFGVGWEGTPFVLTLSKGDGSGRTFNGSTDAGTVLVEQAILDANSPIVLATMSQGSVVTWNALYLIHRDHPEEEGKIVAAYIAADPRFPNTGLETWFPSFLPGLATNGPHDPADTGSIPIVSQCIMGDPVCGFNPYNVSSYFYALPGFFELHSKQYGNVPDMTIVKQWTEGSTTYQALDPGANPWGMLLRDVGIPVPKQFDEALTAAVPLATPGERIKIGDYTLPLPREVQSSVYSALGAKMPVTDPDELDKQSSSVTAPQPVLAEKVAPTSAAVPTGDATPTIVSPKPEAELQQSQTSVDTPISTTVK